jgi:hypothetical protein
MDLKYISPYLLIFIIGIFGLFLTLITLIFTSCINCENEAKQYCKIYNNEDRENVYMDSIPIYFYNLKKQINYNITYFYVEISIVTPLFLFINFIQMAFEMLIIYYLNPNYKLISDCIYYAIKILIEFSREYSREEDNKYTLLKFTFEFVAEILAILGYMIYLEIIELRFCGFDSNIKKNIIDRSFKESNIEALDISISPLNDDNDNENDSDSDDEMYEKEEKENIELEKCDLSYL